KDQSRIGQQKQQPLQYSLFRLPMPAAMDSQIATALHRAKEQFAGPLAAAQFCGLMVFLHYYGKETHQNEQSWDDLPPTPPAEKATTCQYKARKGGAAICALMSPRWVSVWQNALFSHTQSTMDRLEQSQKKLMNIE